MVKIRWMITDLIEDVDLKDFNAEWNGIYGYFEICINNKMVDYLKKALIYGHTSRISS